MLIKQKNCLIANLCRILIAHGFCLEDLFWALIDIDDINYKKYTTDWVPNYLTELGIYDDGLWSASLATNLDRLQQHILDEPENLQLLVVPIKNLTYRQDLGSHIHQNERHAVLIHKNNRSLFLEDWAIGVTGDRYSATPLHAEQFVFPFTYWKFDNTVFINRLFAVNLQEKTKSYADFLMERKEQIQILKHRLLINTVQKNDLEMLASTNLYEESYYYRAFFVSKQSVNADLHIYQEQYNQELSKFKGLFLRMQNCDASSEIQQLQDKAIDRINRLSKLDCKFYHAFSKHFYA